MMVPAGLAGTHAADANIRHMHPRIAKLHSAQAVRFVITGATLLLVDWALFVGLSALGVATVVANPIARGCGALLGFWMHGSYTFAGGGSRRLGWAVLGRYLPSWTVLTVLGTLALSAITREFGLQLAWLAKPVLEVLLAVVSYFVWRGWVFRPDA